MEPGLAMQMPAARRPGRAARRSGCEAGALPDAGAPPSPGVVLRELTGPRRLRPADAAGEIDILRALAMALTATAGRLLTLDEVQDGLHRPLQGHRHRRLRRGLPEGPAPPCPREAEQLIRLCENVTGVGQQALRRPAGCRLRRLPALREGGAPQPREPGDQPGPSGRAAALRARRGPERRRHRPDHAQARRGRRPRSRPTRASATRSPAHRPRLRRS